MAAFSSQMNTFQSSRGSSPPWALVTPGPGSSGQGQAGTHGAYTAIRSQPWRVSCGWDRASNFQGTGLPTLSLGCSHSSPSLVPCRQKTRMEFRRTPSPWTHSWSARWRPFATWWTPTWLSSTSPSATSCQRPSCTS